MKTYLTILAWLAIFVAASGLACRKSTPTKSAAKETGQRTSAKAASSAKTQADTNAVGPNIPAEAVAESVAVTVNGVDILESEIEAQIKPQLEKIAVQSAKLPPSLLEQYEKQLRQQTLEGMIVEQLLTEKVKANGIVVTDEEAIEQLKKMASQQNLSLEELKALIEAYGKSFDEVKQRIREGLGYQKLMEAQWVGKMNITEDDAKKYYSENTKEFEVPEQVRASHILIKPDTTDPNTDPNEAKAKAQDLLKQIRNGADFATLARENSDCPSAKDGGDLNFFGRGLMVPAFEKVAFELKVGQVSNIVETQHGYHIIKVTDHKDARVTTFEQAKDNIINELTRKKKSELAIEYIESLKAKANIVYPVGKEPNSVPIRP